MLEKNNIKNQNKFRKKISGIFKSIKYYSIENTIEDFQGKNIQSIISVDINNVNAIINLVSDDNYIIFDKFETSNISGFFYKDEGNCIGMIFSVNDSSIPKSMNFDMNLFGKLFMDLKKAGKKFNLKLLLEYELFPYHAFYKAYNAAIINKLKFKKNNFYYKLYENSFNEYTGFFLKYRNNPLIIDDILAEKEYNHIKLFSHLYIWIMKVLSENLNNTNNLIIHDAGTEMAFLPMILSSLFAKKTSDIYFKKIYASDINSFKRLKEFRYIDFIKKNIKVPINFFKLDLTDLNFHIPECDITTAIDVLEHLPDEESAINAVKKLWDKTKQIMIIHVPYDSEETKWHDHNIIFNQDKIRKWASYFNDADYISELYKESKGGTLCDLGFLILKRKLKY